MTPDNLVVNLHSLRVHVSCWGDLANPPLLLLHGMRDHSRSWDWVASALASNYRIYAPDLRGHGNSDWTGDGTYSMAHFVLDLADLTVALGLARCAIVGHSFGGAIGLRYTSAFPDDVAGFVGIECVELPLLRGHRAAPQPHPQHLRHWIDTERERRNRAPRHYATLADAQDRMRAESRDLPAATIAHLARHAANIAGDGTWRWKYDPAVRYRAPDDVDGRDLDEMLAAIACPVMLAYGTDSWVPIPPPSRLDRIRHVSVVEFSGASHWLHHTARDAFTDAVRAFLSTLPES